MAGSESLIRGIEEERLIELDEKFKKIPLSGWIIREVF